MMQQKRTASHDAHTERAAVELRDLLHSLTRHFDTCSRHATQSGEVLPASNAQALIILLDFKMKDATPTLSDIVELLDIDKSNVTRLCQRMQEAGHILITRDANDRRAKRLELSRSGEELARFIQTASLERYDEVISSFDNAERDALLEHLAKLNTTLSTIAS